MLQKALLLMDVVILVGQQYENTTMYLGSNFISKVKLFGQLKFINSRYLPNLRCGSYETKIPFFCGISCRQNIIFISSNIKPTKSEKKKEIKT